MRLRTINVRNIKVPINGLFAGFSGFVGGGLMIDYIGTQLKE